MATNFEALLPALREMIRQKENKDEIFALEAALTVSADVVRDIHRIADALEMIAKRP